jgi:hypothetical protein
MATRTRRTRALALRAKLVLAAIKGGNLIGWNDIDIDVNADSIAC